MGQSATDSNQQTILSMKFLVVLAFAGLALAEPEADADAGHFYNSYYGYRPLSYGHFGYGYRYGNYYPHSYGGYHYYGKREAGAEAEADPALVYTTSTLNQGLQQHSVVQTPVVQTPLVYNTNTFQTPVVQTPVVYNTNTFQTPVAVQTVHQSSPVVSNVYNAALQTPLVKAFPSLRTTQVTHITKREAGAEAEADPAFVYTTNNFPITGVNTFNTAVPQFATVNQYAAVNPQFVTPQVAAFSHPITSINNLPVRCLNGLC